MPAFGREMANSAEVRESLLADQPFQKCPFSLMGQVEVRFVARSFSQVRDFASLAFSPLRTNEQKVLFRFE
jgi:hypothetical protein